AQSAPPRQPEARDDPGLLGLRVHAPPPLARDDGAPQRAVPLARARHARVRPERGPTGARGHGEARRREGREPSGGLDVDSRQRPMPLSPGSRVGTYEVIAPIGRGGMGEVYRARDTKLQRDVALKTLPEEFSQDRERLARFEREARLLASLNHSN